MMLRTSPGTFQPWMQSPRPCQLHLSLLLEVLSLSCSYMLVLCLGYAVTGEPSDFEGLDFKEDAVRLAASLAAGILQASSCLPRWTSRKR